MLQENPMNAFLIPYVKTRFEVKFRRFSTSEQLPICWGSIAGTETIYCTQACAITFVLIRACIEA